MKTIKDWAMAYNEMGWAVVPISADKKPMKKWKVYQTEDQPSEVVEAWWDEHPDAGIAVITGPKSGICVVDCDSDAAADYCESIGMTSLVSQETKRGLHYFFKHEEFTKSQTKFNGVDGLDIRGDGGLVKVYPSTGYRWVLPAGVKVSDIPFEIPVLKLGTYETPKGGDAGLDLSNISSMYEVPDEVTDGGRNNEMTRLVGKTIQENPALWGLELAQLIWRENIERFKPPLDKKEVATICNSIMDSHKANNPDEFNEQGERKEAVLTNTEKRVRENMRMLFEFDAIGLCGVPPEREWLVEGIIPAGLPGVLASPGGVGKTYLLMDLALKIACPRPDNNPTFFGKPVRKHGKVVMFLAEDDSAELMRRFEHLDPYYARIFHPEQLIVIPIPELEKGISLGTKQFDAPKFTEEAHGWFDTLTQLDNLAMVVFDPLQSFFDWRFDEDNVAADRALKWAQSIAVKTGAAVIFTHHLRKEDISQMVNTPQAAISKIRGAGNIVNSSRFAIPIWRPSEEVAAEVGKRLGVEGNNMVFMAGLGKENFGGDVSTHWLVRDPVTGLLIDRTEEVGGSSIELPEKVVKGVKVEHWLQEVGLGEEAQWLTRGEVSKGSGVSGTSSKRAIAQLIEDHKVVEVDSKIMWASRHPDFPATYERVLAMLGTKERLETIEGVVEDGMSMRNLARLMRSDSAKILFKSVIKFLTDEESVDIVRFSNGKSGVISTYLKIKKD